MVSHGRVCEERCDICGICWGFLWLADVMRGHVRDVVKNTGHREAYGGGGDSFVECAREDALP